MGIIYFILLTMQFNIYLFQFPREPFFSFCSSYFQEYGFYTLNYVDYLSLIGDQVDNIKGVRGIGTVGAKKLVQQFSKVENIYQNLSQLPANVRNLLENQQELVYQNKKIISLVKNIALPVYIDQEGDFE